MEHPIVFSAKRSELLRYTILKFIFKGTARIESLINPLYVCVCVVFFVAWIGS